MAARLRFPPLPPNKGLWNLELMLARMVHMQREMDNLLYYYNRVCSAYKQTCQQYDERLWCKQNDCKHLTSQLYHAQSNIETLSDLHHKCEEMEELVCLQQNRLKQLECENLDQTAKIRHYKETNYRLAKKNKGFEVDAQNHAREVRELNRKTVNNTDLCRMRAENGKLLQEIEILRQKLAAEAQNHTVALQQKNEEMGELKTNNNNLMIRLNRMQRHKTELQETNQGHCGEMKASGSQALTAQYEQPRVELTEQESPGPSHEAIHDTEIDNLKRQIKTYLEIIQKQEKSMEELKRTGKELQDQHEIQRGQIKKLEAGNDKHQKLQIQQLEDGNTLLVRQIDGTHLIGNKPERQVEELKHHAQQEKTFLVKELAQLKRNYEQLAEEERNAREKIGQLSKVKSDNVSLEGDLQKHKNMQKLLVNENAKLKEQLQNKKKDCDTNKDLLHQLDVDKQHRTDIEKKPMAPNFEDEMQRHAQMEDMIKRQQKSLDELTMITKEQEKQFIIQKDKIQELEVEIKQHQILQQQLKDENVKLEEQMNQGLQTKKHNVKTVKEVDELNQELSREKRDRGKLEAEILVLKQQYEEMDQKYRHAKVEIEELSQRLAAEMNDKISKDERNLENVSIASRPMTIATEYGQICSDQWLEAKTAADEILGDISNEEKLQFLSNVFLIALKQSTSHFQVLLARLQEFVGNPFESHGDHRGAVEVIQRNTRIMDTMESSFTDLLRINAEKTDLTRLYQTINQATALAWPDYRRLIKHEHLTHYIDTVARLTWKMALQKPPMEFSQIGIGEPWMGEQFQTVFWGSADPKSPGSKVICYVHPILMHGETVMAKGNVLIKE